MRLTTPTTSLLEAVGHTAAIAAAKSPKPILECIALRATAKEGVRLEANDLDVSLRVALPDARVEEDGVVAVPAQRAASVLREVAEGRAEITLVGAENRLEVDTEGCHFRVNGEDPQEFPPLDSFPETGHVTVPFGVLRSMIERTQFATAREPGRFALHGVQFRFASAEVEVVATDGRRLARAVHPISGGPAAELRVILGTKPLSILCRLSADASAPVDIAVADRRIYFRCGQALMSSRLVDGAFPPYEQVIPAPSPKGFDAKVDTFATALRRASLLTTKEARSVTFDFEPGHLVLSARSQDVGEAKVDMEIPYAEGKDRLGFNPDYLLDALKVMSPEASVRFEFSTSRAPAKISDGASYVYVVSPVSVGE